MLIATANSSYIWQRNSMVYYTFIVCSLDMAKMLKIYGLIDNIHSFMACVWFDYSPLEVSGEILK